jgi:hypothetical protein
VAETDAVTPLDKAVPDEAESLMLQAYSLLPHLKITELLLEVDSWTGFTRHFKHLKSGVAAQDQHLLLTTILADTINLGLSKMAEACPGTTYAKLAWLQAWHIRDETYSAGLAELVNAQFRQPFASYWGDGTTSSSDGQHFKAGGRGQFAGPVNLKYGQEPSVQFYTHISDHYAPFHTKVINATVHDATHVLDGLLYHESDVRIEEHYTDTAGFTDLKVPMFLARNMAFLAEAALWEGQTEEAADWLAQSLAYPDPPIIIYEVVRLFVAAHLATAQGQYRRAATLFGLAEQANSQIHDAYAGPLRTRTDIALAKVRAALDPDVFAEAFAEGQRLSLGEAFAAILHPRAVGA